MRITILYLSLQNKLSVNICFYSGQNQKAARAKCLQTLKKSIEVCVEVKTQTKHFKVKTDPVKI